MDVVDNIWLYSYQNKEYFKVYRRDQNTEFVFSNFIFRKIVPFVR